VTRVCRYPADWVPRVQASRQDKGQDVPLRTLPPYKGGVRCCHVSHGSRPPLPTGEGFGVLMSKFGKGEKTGLPGLSNRSIRFW
jgi:hypothetical protein